MTDFPDGNFDLDPPYTEADGFLIEAALQLGADPHPTEDEVYIVPAHTLIELARRVRHSPTSRLPRSNHVKSLDRSPPDRLS